jgi:fluoroquinolone resistance protein
MQPLDSHNEYTGIKYKSNDYRGIKLDKVVFTECEFTRCNFKEALFTGCEFHGCIFTKCDLSLIQLKKCNFSQTTFKDCQIIGVNWQDTSLAKKPFLKPVDYEQCVLNYSTFMGLFLNKIRLFECIVHEVDFSDADLSGTDCRRTDFQQSRFYHTNLTGSDFGGATNYSISVLENTIKKAKFSLPEAVSLLSSLDIVLVDDDLGKTLE